MKHAFLILAHNNFKVLKCLLHQLDNENSDIYIHINSKVGNFPKEELENCVKNTKVVFVPRVAVGYCDYSMIEGIKSLMKTASETYHDYYHIISGADMVIKNQKDFMAFFEENNGCEFVGFSKNYNKDRVIYKNYFTARGRQKSYLKSVFFVRLRKLLINIQKKLNIINKIPFEVKKGCDWYSITHNAVIYMLKKEPLFQKYFKYSYCPTEFFPHTVLWNSEFKEKIYMLNSDDKGLQCIRTIDWERGEPYIFRLEDYDFLLKSKGMFARKFDENTDLEIAEKLSRIND